MGMTIEKLKSVLEGKFMNEEEYYECIEFIDGNFDSIKEILTGAREYRLALTDKWLIDVYDDFAHDHKAVEDIFMICKRYVAVNAAKELAEECSYHFDEDLIKNCGISIFCEGDYIEEVEIPRLED